MSVGIPIDYLRDEHYINTFRIDKVTYITMYVKGAWACPLCHRVYTNAKGKYIKANRLMLKHGGYKELNGLLYLSEEQLKGRG